MIEQHTYLLESTKRGYVLIIYCKLTERYHSVNNTGDFFGENCLDNILNRDDLVYFQVYQDAIDTLKGMKILEGKFISDFHDKK